MAVSPILHTGPYNRTGGGAQYANQRLQNTIGRKMGANGKPLTYDAAGNIVHGFDEQGRPQIWDAGRGIITSPHAYVGETPPAQPAHNIGAIPATAPQTPTGTQAGVAPVKAPPAADTAPDWSVKTPQKPATPKVDLNNPVPNPVQPPPAIPDFTGGATAGGGMMRKDSGATLVQTKAGTPAVPAAQDPAAVQQQMGLGQQVQRDGAGYYVNQQRSDGTMAKVYTTPTGAQAAVLNPHPVQVNDQTGRVVDSGVHKTFDKAGLPVTETTTGGGTNGTLVKVPSQLTKPDMQQLDRTYATPDKDGFSFPSNKNKVTFTKNPAPTSGAVIDNGKDVTADYAQGGKYAIAAQAVTPVGTPPPVAPVAGQPASTPAPATTTPDFSVPQKYPASMKQDTQANAITSSWEEQTGQAKQQAEANPAQTAFNPSKATTEEIKAQNQNIANQQAQQPTEDNTAALAAKQQDEEERKRREAMDTYNQAIGKQDQQTMIPSRTMPML